MLSLVERVIPPAVQVTVNSGNNRGAEQNAFRNVKHLGNTRHRSGEVLEDFECRNSLVFGYRIRASGEPTGEQVLGGGVVPIEVESVVAHESHKQARSTAKIQELAAAVEESSDYSLRDPGRHHISHYHTDVGALVQSVGLFEPKWFGSMNTTAARTLEKEHIVFPEYSRFAERIRFDPTDVALSDRSHVAGASVHARSNKLTAPLPGNIVEKRRNKPGTRKKCRHDIRNVGAPDDAGHSHSCREQDFEKYSRYGHEQCNLDLASEIANAVQEHGARVSGRRQHEPETETDQQQQRGSDAAANPELHDSMPKKHEHGSSRATNQHRVCERAAKRPSDPVMVTACDRLAVCRPQRS